MNVRRLPTLLSTLVAATLLLIASPAEAGQTTVKNPPASMRPGSTNTVHEIGLSTNGNFSPDAFIPAFNWRFHLPSTGRQGPLSGLYMGLDVGPAVNFHGYGHWRGRDFRQIWGHGGFEIGYEFAPFSNLALTISPVLHNDFHFSPYFFQFVQTFGPAIRLYINQHWVFYFEPGLFGWHAWSDGFDHNHNNNNNNHVHTGAGFSLRGGVGFAYKF